MLHNFLLNYYVLGRALNCYVCDSATDVTCGESLPYFHSLLPIDCADTLESPQYCIKQTGLYEGSHHLKYLH